MAATIILAIVLGVISIMLTTTLLVAAVKLAKIKDSMNVKFNYSIDADKTVELFDKMMDHMIDKTPEYTKKVVKVLEEIEDMD